MALKIGDTLAARGKPTYRLVGVDDGCWIGEPLDSFGGPVVLDADALKPYKLDDSTPPPVLDDAAMAAVRHERDRAANDAAFSKMLKLLRGRDGIRSDVADARTSALQRGRPAWTPSERFEALSETEEGARAAAEKLAQDPARLEDVASGTVQISPVVLRYLREILGDYLSSKGQPL